MTRGTRIAAHLRPYLFLLAVPLVPWTQSRVDQTFGAVRDAQTLYLWSGRDVRRLAPGFENVMADLYWLRTVQHFGGQRAFSQDKRFPLLRPLIEITVALDPRFEIAYRYGATFLSEPWPIGAGDPGAGVALLRRGIVHRPASWLLRQDLAFFLFHFLKDAREASDVLLRASREPGAPPWFPALAADFLKKGGEREVSRRVWRQIHDAAEKGPMRENAKAHLEHLDALDAADALTRASKAYAARQGRPAESVEQLVRAGVLRRSPVDPAGAPFVYDRDTGTFSLSRESPVWRPL